MKSTVNTMVVFPTLCVKDSKPSNPILKLVSSQVDFSNSATLAHRNTLILDLIMSGWDVQLSEDHRLLVNKIAVLSQEDFLESVR